MKIIERDGGIRYRVGALKMVHRTDCPAVLWGTGASVWHQKGRPHREDGPGGLSPRGGAWGCKNGQVLAPDWLNELFA